MKYNIEKRVFVIKSVYKLGNFVEVRRAFKSKSNTKQVPSNGSIQVIINTFEKKTVQSAVYLINRKNKRKKDSMP